jgi:apolipoprotein N-acyltransferase
MLGLIDLILEIGELFLSWRLYLGLAFTAATCWVLASVIPNQTAQWAVGLPVGLLGAILSFRWQLRADFGKR